MLDPKFVKENRDKVAYAIKNKKVTIKIDVDQVIEKYDTYIKTLQDVESLRSARNKISEAIATAKPEERKQKIEEAAQLKNDLVNKEMALQALWEELEVLLVDIPNVMANEVPLGEDDTQNTVIRTWGEPTKFDFTPKDHVEIGESLGLINIEKSAQVSGTRFNYLLGDAARLQFAIVQFVFDSLTNPVIMKELAEKSGNKNPKLFIPVVPPVMIKPEIMKKMDRFNPVEERYVLRDDDLMLVGSAEHTLGPLHMDEVLKEEELPARYIGYSTAFRREAGSYGKDTKGILRVHQFDKLEMESFSMPEDGLAEQDLIVAVQEYLVQQLNIPYQVMMICTGDMGKPDYRQIDIECWIPAQNKYRETHTSDYMTDYQARRLNIRYKGKETNGLVHMNDATAIAIGRMIIAILENYQQADGSIKIPDVLVKYMGKNIITAKK